MRKTDTVERAACRVEIGEMKLLYFAKAKAGVARIKAPGVNDVMKRQVCEDTIGSTHNLESCSSTYVRNYHLFGSKIFGQSSLGDMKVSIYLHRPYMTLELKPK